MSRDYTIKLRVTTIGGEPAIDVEIGDDSTDRTLSVVLDARPDIASGLAKLAPFLQKPVAEQLREIEARHIGGE